MIKRLSTNYTDLSETAKEIARQQVYDIEGENFINDRLEVLFYNVRSALEKTIGTSDVETVYNGGLEISVKDKAISLGNVTGLEDAITENIYNDCTNAINDYELTAKANKLADACWHVLNSTDYILNAHYNHANDNSVNQEITIEIQDYNYDFDKLLKILGDNENTEANLTAVENILNNNKTNIVNYLQKTIENKFEELIEEFENNIEQMYIDADKYAKEQIVDYDFDEEGNIK